jgi:thiol-disulfide isomerase/thioredoxin
MKTTVLMLATVVFSLCALCQQTTTLSIGSAAPGFNLKGIDGKMYSLNSFKKSDILVIMFTCNHCPTAQAYEDRMINMVNTYKNKNVAFVAITSNNPAAVRLGELAWTDYDDSYEDTKKRAKEKKFNFTYLWDGDKQETALKYGPVATPHIFIFDKLRKLQYTGRIDDVEDPKKTPASFDMINALDAMVASKPVPVATTKVFGCSIKWKSKTDWRIQAKKDWAAEPVTLQQIDSTGIVELMKNNTEKTRVINVWATWCGPCVAEFPDLIEMNHIYRNRDFELVTISADQIKNEAKVLKFLKTSNASNTNYIFNTDNKYALIEAVDPAWDGAIPITLVIEPGGKIVYKKMGEFEPVILKKAIVESKPLGRYF